MKNKDFLESMAEIVEVPAGTLTGWEKLEDLEGWSSVSMVSFIAFADEHFGKALSPRQFVGCETIADLGRLVGVEE